MAKTIDFWQARKDFRAHLNHTKRYSPGTCYLGIWADGWRRRARIGGVSANVDVEQFASWQIRERGVKAHIVSRWTICLSSFYKRAMKNGLVETDPAYLADKHPGVAEEGGTGSAAGGHEAPGRSPREHLRAHPRAHKGARAL